MIAHLGGKYFTVQIAITSTKGKDVVLVVIPLLLQLPLYLMPFVFSYYRY